MLLNSTSKIFCLYFISLFLLLGVCCWVRLSLGVKSGGSSLVVMHRLSLWWLLFVVEWRLQGTWSSEVGVHWLTCPAACGIFANCVPCIDRWILLNHWTTRCPVACFVNCWFQGKFYDNIQPCLFKSSNALRTFVSASREQTKNYYQSKQTKTKQKPVCSLLCWNGTALLKAHLRGGKYCSSQPAWTKESSGTQRKRASSCNYKISSLLVLQLL